MLGNQLEDNIKDAGNEAEGASYLRVAADGVGRERRFEVADDTMARQSLPLRVRHSMWFEGTGT
jgi:hypothetical protein